MKSEFLDNPLSVVLVPSLIAVCPVCQGPLSALLVELEQAFVGVNLYTAMTAMLTCLIDDDAHQASYDEGWDAAYNDVSQWLKRGGVLVEMPDELWYSQQSE